MELEAAPADLSNKQKLESAAAFMREVAANEEIDPDQESPWFPEMMLAMAEWLEVESQRHVNLGGLDSGYEQVNVWESPMMDRETAELEPCIRVANLFLDHCTMIEADIEEVAAEAAS